MNKIFKAIDSLERCSLLRIVRRGLAMMIPMVLTAAVAQSIISFPIAGFRELIASFGGGVILKMLTYMNRFVFSYFSVMLCITTSTSYVIEKSKRIEIAVFAPAASASAYLLITSTYTGGSYLDLGVRGTFMAIIVALSVSGLYLKLINSRLSDVGKHIEGNEIVYEAAIHSIIPMAIVILGAALFLFFMSDVFGIKSIVEIVSIAMDSLFNKFSSEFVISMFFTFFIHLFWFIGIHGSNALESIMQMHLSVGSGITFSKTMFDVFVIMGGCGTTICLLLAIFIVARQRRTKNIAKAALFPVLFNINEVVTFGIPIIWNPIMFVPFILVPMECMAISYFALKVGMIAPIVNQVEWTTPIFASGYIATGGSISGILLQIVCLAVGTITYIPFVRIQERAYMLKMKRQIKEITDAMKESEANGTEFRLAEYNNELGFAVRMLITDLECDIKAKKLFLMYQPQVDADGRCIGAEALLRWNHPICGFIYPPLIIYLAQTGRYLKKLEKFIFDTACAAIKKVETEYDEKFKISVNITARSLEWDGLEGYINKTVKKYDIDAEKLWIEVTEKDILSKDQAITDRIEGLKSKGHKFLIDDFGMGKTSLLYLQTNMFDGVKLDGSLVKNILDNNTNREIVASVISLSEKLGVNVIAEYVEMQEQLAMLDNMGCNWYQGYYFSRPIPLDDFLRFIMRNKERSKV